MQVHFDCIFYYVSDLERSIAFYRDTLGFRLTSRDAVVRFDLNGVLFELVPSEDESKLQGSGNARLALRVDNLGETIQQLSQRGVHASDPQTKPGGLLSFFNDPDGNEICLWQYVRR